MHPLLLEAGEALGRGAKYESTALALRNGSSTIKTIEEASEIIVESSLFDMSLKLLMAFYRRFMLLNIGNTEATMFAVVAASVEEAGVLQTN